MWDREGARYEPIAIKGVRPKSLKHDTHMVLVTGEIKLNSHLGEYGHEAVDKKNALWSTIHCLYHKHRINSLPEQGLTVPG